MSSRRRRYRYRPKPQVKRPPANKEITAPIVRLIGPDGTQMGDVSLEEARNIADKAESDLVMVAQKADPPVVRVLDFGKHVYDQRKKEAKQKAKTKGKDIKGVRIGFKTGDHDWQLRLKQTAKFLDAGHKVKLEVRLRGRERQRGDLARQKIQQFITEVPDGAKLEGTISQSGNALSALLTLDKK